MNETLRRRPRIIVRWLSAVSLVVAATGISVLSARQLASRPAPDWIARLERPERVATLKIDYLISKLQLKPGRWWPTSAPDQASSACRWREPSRPAARSTPSTSIRCFSTTGRSNSGKNILRPQVDEKSFL